MNRYIKLIFGGVASLMIAMPLTGCNDVDRDYDSLVPENYHTILSLRDAGVQDVTMAVAEGSHTYELAVLKGGVDIDAVVDVMLEFPDQAYVDEHYNDKQGTRYRVLSASMYSVEDYHLKIQPGQSGKSAIITFDTKKIYAALQQPENQGMDMVLPVRLTSAGNSVNSNSEEAILHCTVSPVVVEMSADRMKVKLPDNEPSFTTSFVVEKRGEMATTVHFNVLSQAELDEKYGIPEGVGYKVLPPSMYTMDAAASIDLSTEFYSHPVTFDVTAISGAMMDDPQAVWCLPLQLVSDDASTVVGREDLIMVVDFHEYAINDLVTRENWSVVYGTIAMPFGMYEKMFDGISDGDGWMGYINDGWPGSQDMGTPFVVMDLGSRYMLGELGVDIGHEGGWYDTNPMAVEFYVSEDTDIDPQLTSTEWDMLNARGNYGDPNHMSEECVAVQQRLRAFDEGVNWVKVGAVTGIEQTAAGNGTYWLSIPMNILSRQMKTRYLKVVPVPFPFGVSIGDRVKIHELHVRNVTAIDGEPVY